MRVRLIGDVHGKFWNYERILSGVDRSLQVGDMGVGFPANSDSGPRLSRPRLQSPGEHLFIRGNHDDPDYCRQVPGFVPDGTSPLDGLFCVGGATSIDRAYRIEGVSWWPNEELTVAELDEIVDRYVDLKPEVMVTHEAPESIAEMMLRAFNKVKIADGSRTRQALESMFFHWQPRFWIFGHWHVDLSFSSGGTRFVCLNELSHVDLDLESMEMGEVVSYQEFDRKTEETEEE